MNSSLITHDQDCRFALEFPSIVRDSLNPHADLLRELKHKRDYFHHFNITLVLDDKSFISSITAVLPSAAEARVRQLSGVQHQPSDDGDMRAQDTAGLDQVYIVKHFVYQSN